MKKDEESRKQKGLGVSGDGVTIDHYAIVYEACINPMRSGDWDVQVEVRGFCEHSRLNRVGTSDQRSVRAE